MPVRVRPPVPYYNNPLYWGFFISKILNVLQSKIFQKVLAFQVEYCNIPSVTYFHLSKGNDHEERFYRRTCWWLVASSCSC